MLRRFTSRPGFIPWMLGLVLIAELAITRLAFRADENLVYFLGHPVNIVCAFRQQFHLPCPTCGFTRGFVLTVHGNLWSAWHLSPSGPLFAIATAAGAIICFLFAILQLRAASVSVVKFRKCVQMAAFAYSIAGIGVWLATWVSVVRGMRG